MTTSTASSTALLFDDTMSSTYENRKNMKTNANDCKMRGISSQKKLNEYSKRDEDTENRG